jgi:DNA-binding beta-propeller fold protein YncE
MKKLYAPSPYAACFILFAVFAVTGLARTARDQGDPPLRLIHTTLLPGYLGDFEHFTVDMKGNRLFLVAEDHHTVEVLDPHTGERIHTIDGFTQPHAAIYLPESNKLIVTDGSDDFGAVRLISGKDYKILDSIKLPSNVDGAVYSPVDENYYVESQSSEAGEKKSLLNIIDTRSFKHIGDITLPGNRPEAMAIDHAGKKLYINLSGANVVGVVDLQSRQLVAKWPIPDAQVENALALDEADHRLFTASHKPPKLIVFDMETGNAITSLPCVVNSDDMSYDRVRKRIYVTGDGNVSVFAQRDSDHYEHLADIPTGYRAKTSIFLPELDRLYIAVASKGTRAAGKLAVPEPGSKVEVQIYQAQP